MYRQIETTTFLLPKIIVEKTKERCKTSCKRILEKLRLEIPKGTLEISIFNNVKNVSLQSKSDIGISCPSEIPSIINIPSDDIKSDNESSLEACLNRMPTIQRSAFVYKTFEGKNTSSICTDLNINEMVFWRLIHNARKELVESLDLN